MGYEDLSVIDPTTGEAKTAETDLNDVRWCPVGMCDGAMDKCIDLYVLNVIILCLCLSEVWCSFAATPKGVYWIQGIPGEGYHKSCDSARMDHAAFYHASKYG